MARESGHKGRVLLSVSPAASPEIIVLNSWSLDETQDQFEVTSFGDANKTYVTGLPDLSGQFSGFLDTADDKLFKAARSTNGANLYLYPDAVGNPAKYWYGLANISSNINVSTSGAIAISGNFSARGSWTRIWA